MGQITPGRGNFRPAPASAHSSSSCVSWYAQHPDHHLPRLIHDLITSLAYPLCCLAFQVQQSLRLIGYDTQVRHQFDHDPWHTLRSTPFERVLPRKRERNISRIVCSLPHQPDSSSKITAPVLLLVTSRASAPRLQMLTIRSRREAICCIMCCV